VPVDSLTRAMHVLGRRPDPLLPAHLVRGDVPAGFSAVLNTAMELDGDSRPRSASEFRNMLRRHEEYAFQAPAAMAAASQSAASFVTDGNLDFETHVRSGPPLPQSSIPTELMPTNASQVTSVPAGLFSHTNAGNSETRITTGVSTFPPARRKFTAAAALAAVVVMVLAVSAGAVYYGPYTLFGGGSAAGDQQGQALPGGGPEGQGSNGAAGSQEPAPVSQPPTGQPSETGVSIPSDRPAEPETPTIDPGPAEPGPKAPETVRKAPAPAEPKQKSPGRRVDTIEIDRLPGGVRGVKVTRDRPKKSDSGGKDDGTGFRFTKIPGIFKSVPSKMRIVPPKKKKTKQ